MNKKMIVLACVAVISAPLAAQAADLEVYGKARMALTAADNADTLAGKEDSSLAVTSYDSRLGFKGSEDLGNGMKAIYQYEIQVDLDEESTTNKTRDAFVGLKGDFGTVKMGRLSLPYKKATSGFDAFDDMEADFNGGDEGIIGHNNRENNTIAYESKDISGAKFSVAYSTSVVNDELPQSTADSDSSAISAMASYTMGPLFISAAYETIEDAGVEDNAAKGAVRYTLGEDKIGLVIDHISGQEPTVFVNYDHKLGENYGFHVAVAARGEKDSQQNAMNYFAVGAKHAYSKNVEVYALFTQVNNDPGSKVSLKKAKVASAGDDISAISIGMNINFSTK